MTTINDGGPAFPCVDHMGDGPQGMTLRDYFAAAALPAVIEWLAVRGRGESGWTKEDAAGHAYDVADAMLTARDQQP